MDDLDTPRWSSADLRAAAGIDGMTFKNWGRYDPPLILTDARDRAAGGTGGRHLFTLRRVLQVALTAELVDQGFPPRLAATAAASWSDLGDAALPGSPERRPGELFPEGWTVLLAHRHRDPWVVNWHPDRPLGPQLLGHPMGAGPCGSFVVVDLVRARVLRTLRQRTLPEAQPVPEPVAEPV